MSPIPLPTSPLPELAPLELTREHAPLLQRLFDANPAFFMLTQGEPAQPDEAYNEINDSLPAHWPFTKKWVIGYQNPAGELAALANLVQDILAPGVWNLSTFFLETGRHGNGQAQLLYQSLEQWVRSSGGQFMRLGVVQGNTRAERFWQAQGFVQTRLRHDVQMGQKINVLRAMMKPLAGGTLAQYWALVERDRPESD
jgi:GNAT superfamily N-acetyltransferase